MSKINPMPEITILLKQLKLQTFIDNLYKHNKTAIENKLNYPEFLTLLLQDEILMREQKRFISNMKMSRLRGDKTLENFNFGSDLDLDYKKIKEIASCRFVEEKVSAVIVGPTGSGKTHLAHAIGNCAVRQNIPTLFITTSKLIEEIKSSILTKNYERYKKKICKLPLLIIDDFGLKPFATPEEEYFHEIISDRYENSATLITSNLDFSEWIQAFPNKLLGVATIDRIRDKAYLLVFEKDSLSHRQFKEKTVIKNNDNKEDLKLLEEAC